MITLLWFTRRPHFQKIVCDTEEQKTVICKSLYFANRVFSALGYNNLMNKRNSYKVLDLSRELKLIIFCLHSTLSIHVLHIMWRSLCQRYVKINSKIRWCCNGQPQNPPYINYQDTDAIISTINVLYPFFWVSVWH